LKAATDYIKLMRNRNQDFQSDIDSLRKQNLDIENQSKIDFTQNDSCRNLIKPLESGYKKRTFQSLLTDYSYENCTWQP
jgi:hypothetical protein